MYTQIRGPLHQVNLTARIFILAVFCAVAANLSWFMPRGTFCSDTLCGAPSPKQERSHYSGLNLASMGSSQPVLKPPFRGALQLYAASVQEQQADSSAGSFDRGPVADANGYCLAQATTLSPRDGDWTGWSVDVDNARYQPTPGFEGRDIPKLKLKWAFGFANQSTASSQPTVVGQRVFVGSAGGEVYSLDARTGCMYWKFRGGAEVRTAVVVGRLPSGKWSAFFGDSHAWLHAVDAETGELLWEERLDHHPAARITGSPALLADRIYVPLSSIEEGYAQSTKYSCCTFRGSVSALDVSTGRKIWQTYTVRDPSKAYQQNRNGTQLFGPAGAAVWSAPTIDREKKLLYVTTGNSYTGIEIDTSDAVLALELNTGKLVWSRQLLTADNYIVGCPSHPNCPDEPGGDLDLGASALLRSLPNGRRVLIVCQKSGFVYALDPDAGGQILWKKRVGKGGMLGGIMWGAAADSKYAYVAVSDRLWGREGAAGLYALDLTTGQERWETPAPASSGNPAQSAAVTAIPGVIFSGALDGHLRAYSSDRGQIIWDFDTDRSFETINGVRARGGSIDGPGPVITHGLLLTNSGYGVFAGTPGNVLLAFSVEPR